MPSQRRTTLPMLLPVFLTATLLASCGTTGVVTEFCSVASPIYVSRDDKLTDQTARQILAANEKWSALCRK